MLVGSSKSPSLGVWLHGFMSPFKQAVRKSAAKEDLHCSSQPPSWPNPSAEKGSHCSEAIFGGGAEGTWLLGTWMGARTSPS